MGDDEENTKEQDESSDTITPLTIDEAVDKIYTGANWKIILIYITAVGSVYVTAAETYITVFTGFIPYTAWECISEECFTARNASEDKDSFYSYKSMCENEFKAEVDFAWTSKRTSFSVDWGFYCESEAKLSVASSFFFVGACVGLLSSSAIFDRVGRRNGAIIGSVIGALATLGGSWVPGLEWLLVVRVWQGFGQFVNFTGVYCWVVEFAPTHLRTYISAFTLICWSLGYCVTVLVAYLIPSWNYIFMGVGVLNFLLITPLVIYPMSPRFLLVRGKVKEAKKILKSLSGIYEKEIDLEKVNLVYTTRVLNYWEQLKDFKSHHTMLKETLLCMLTWFVCASLFYGFSFGWSKISSDLYISYLFSALGNVLAFSLTVPVCNLLGRKRAMLFFLICGVFSNFLAMPDVKISGRWTLEYAANMIGNVAISGAFATIYIYTCELAPTTHRGMVMSFSSSCARIGSFIGTYTSLLYDITDRRVPLAMFAGVTIISVVAVFFLSDTTGRRIPETPKDVELLAGKNKYQEVKEKQNGEEL